MLTEGLALMGWNMSARQHICRGAAVVLLLVFSSGRAFADRIIYVDDDGPADFNTIQAAIDDANDGDTVLVAPGTYTGEGNRDIDFMGKVITVRSTDPNDTDVVAATIIDCQGTEAEPHRGFRFQTEEGPNSILDGFTITNGYGPVEERSLNRSSGGALFILSSPTVKNCVISQNHAKMYGGGIYFKNMSEARIEGCIIQKNSSNSGGGIYSIDSKATISNCVIAHNSSNTYGGGLDHNQNDGSNIINIIHCTITDNWAADRGGGMSVGSSRVKNSIIWGNNAGEGSNDIHGSPATSYSDTTGNVSGIGNINADPCFVDLRAGDYRLSQISPCINMGDPQYDINSGRFDIEGEDRVIFARTDIGADEFNMNGPYLFVLSTEFLFEAVINGNNPDGQLLYLMNSGSGVLDWKIEEDCSWLFAEEPLGDSRGETDEIALRVDISNLGAGLHESEILVSDPASINGQETIKISLHIESDDGLREVPKEYARIQSAIDWAQSEDTVLISDGIYSGNGNRDINFLGKSITVKSENGPEMCIIDCQGLEQHRGFIFESFEDANSVLSGVTITNGNADLGGAICCFGSPLIEHLVLTGNRAFSGGAIYTGGSRSNPAIRNCLITGNHAIRDSYSSRGYGGGVYFSGYGSWRSGCSLTASLPFITNCTIADNTADFLGGGIYAAANCNVTVSNCIIWANSASRDSNVGFSLMYDACNPLCDILHSNVEGGLAGIDIDYFVRVWQNNIDVNPLFFNPGSWIDVNEPHIAVGPNDPNAVWINGDYHLRSNAGRWDPNSQSWVSDDVDSPCIDAGDPNSPIGGEPFPNGGVINMGAYGSTAEASKSYTGQPVQGH